MRKAVPSIRTLNRLTKWLAECHGRSFVCLTGFAVFVHAYKNNIVIFFILIQLVFMSEKRNNVGVNMPLFRQIGKCPTHILAKTLRIFSIPSFVKNPSFGFCEYTTICTWGLFSLSWKAAYRFFQFISTATARLKLWSIVPRWLYKMHSFALVIYQLTGIYKQIYIFFLKLLTKKKSYSIIYKSLGTAR